MQGIAAIRKLQDRCLKQARLSYCNKSSYCGSLLFVYNSVEKFGMGNENGIVSFDGNVRAYMLNLLIKKYKNGQKCIDKSTIMDYYVVS